MIFHKFYKSYDINFGERNRFQHIIMMIISNNTFLCHFQFMQIHIIDFIKFFLVKHPRIPKFIQGLIHFL